MIYVAWSMMGLTVGFAFGMVWGTLREGRYWYTRRMEGDNPAPIAYRGERYCVVSERWYLGHR